MKKSLIWLGFTLLVYSTFAQYLPSLDIPLTAASTARWMVLQHPLAISPQEFWATHGADLGIGEKDEARLVDKKSIDQHQLYTYQLYHEGYPIKDQLIKLHFQAEGLYLIQTSGSWECESSFVALKPDQAWEILQAAFPQQVFAWNQPEWRAAPGELPKENQQTPSFDLLYLPHPSIPNQYTLAYYRTVRLVEPDEVIAYGMSARTGEIIYQQAQSFWCDATQGQAQTLYNGRQSLELRDRGVFRNRYALESCGQTHIHTKVYQQNSFGQSRAWSWADQLDAEDQDWGTYQQAATSAHWAAGKAWAYFATHWGWNGPDGKGGELRIWTNWTDVAGKPIANSRYLYDGKHHYLYFGSLGTDPMVTLDLVGHEYAHAYLEYVLHVPYQRETGAMLEGLADILGLLIRQEVEQNQPMRWAFGESVQPIRAVDLPELTGHPAYHGSIDPFWQDASEAACPIPLGPTHPQSNDYCGVHQNSTLMSHWFYLLVNGGSIGSYQFGGIGLEAAVSILRRMVSQYLSGALDWQDARRMAIQAAIDEFGSCTPEMLTVQDAWAAVGIGDISEATCLRIMGSDQLCVNFEGVQTYLLEGPAHYTYHWSGIPEGAVYEFEGANRSILHFQYIPAFYEPIQLQAIAQTGQGKDTAILRIIPASCANKAPGEPIIPLHGEGLTLYPNPSQGDTRLFAPLERFPGKIQVYDSQGRMTYQQELLQPALTLPSVNWANGMYRVVIQGQTESHVRSLWIQH